MQTSHDFVYINADHDITISVCKYCCSIIAFGLKPEELRPSEIAHIQVCRELRRAAENADARQTFSDDGPVGVH